VKELTFHLLTPEVGRFVTLPRGPLVPICIEIGQFVFKISCHSQVWQRTDGQVENITTPASLE